LGPDRNTFVVFEKFIEFAHALDAFLQYLEDLQNELMIFFQEFEGRPTLIDTACDQRFKVKKLPRTLYLNKVDCFL